MEKRLREKKESLGNKAVGGGRVVGEREEGTCWKEGAKVNGCGSEGGLGPILSLRKASDVGVMPDHGHKARPVMVEVNGDGKAVQHNNI